MRDFKEPYYTEQCVCCANKSQAIILKLIDSEETLMATKGATFGLNKDYDAGYLTALKDIKILIKGLGK